MHNTRSDPTNFARQRHAQGPTGNQGWTRARAGCALYDGPGGHTEEPGDSHLLSALVSGREGEEAGVDGVHAKAAHHLERHGQKPDAVAGNRRSARLIFKTVADPIFTVSLPRSAAERILASCSSNRRHFIESEDKVRR